MRGTMTDAAPFALLKRNPDVLTCIANLSNDEVFTPPEFAARMLDTLAEGWAATNGGANLWTDSRVTFLDPCTKSGVFLREIAKRLIDGLPLIAAPNSVCTLTYVVAGPLSSENEAKSLLSYTKTRFLRLLVSLRKISQDAPRGVYTFVPTQSWDRKWTDAALYEKYGITPREQAFIESIIRPMEAAD
jgi:hypothetical protein